MVSTSIKGICMFCGLCLQSHASTMTMLNRSSVITAEDCSHSPLTVCLTLIHIKSTLHEIFTTCSNIHVQYSLSCKAKWRRFPHVQKNISKHHTLNGNHTFLWVCNQKTFWKIFFLKYTAHDGIRGLHCLFSLIMQRYKKIRCQRIR